MNYKTRHLEATREITHGSQFLRVGDRFEATETDAEHYLTRNMARPVATPAPRVAPAAPAAAKTARGRAAAAPAAAPAAPAPVAGPATLAADKQRWETTQPMTLADVQGGAPVDVSGAGPETPATPKA